MTTQNPMLMKNKNVYLQWLPWRTVVLFSGMAVCTFGYSQVPSDNEKTAKQLIEDARVLISDSLDYNTSFDKLARADSLLQGSRDSALLTEMHFQQARCLHRKGRQQDALVLLEAVIDYWKKTCGAQHEKTGDALYVQGFCRMDLKMYEPARRDLEETLAIYRKNKGEYYFKTANTLNLLGILNLRETDWNKAFPFIQQAAKIYSAIPPHLNATYPYYNLGLYYSNQRNFTEAIKNLEKSLAIRQQFLPPGHRDFYNVFQQLAYCYPELGNMDKTLQYYQRGLQIAEKHYGEKSCQYAESLSSLSFCSWTMERDLPGGVQSAEKAIEIYESIGYGATGECARAYNNLAICHQYLGNIDKALLYNEKALHLRIQLFGEHDCDNTLTSINNIALCYSKQGHYEKALSYYLQDLDARLKYCEKYHPYTATSYNNIAHCYWKLGKNAEALENFARSNEIFSSPQVEGHYQSHFPLQNLGWYYFQEHDYPTALYYFDKAIACATRVFSAHSPLLADFFIAKSKVKTAQGEFAAAQGLIDSALQAIRFDGSPGKVLSRFALLNAWEQRAEIFKQQYRASHQISFLHEARIFSKKALDLLHDIAVDFTESSSKSEIILNNYTDYERAIWVETELARLQGKCNETPFTYSERSKSLSLYQSIRESKALHFAGIPDSLLQQERRLREEMTYLDKTRQEKLNTGSAETDTNVLALSNQFLKIKRRYDALSDRLETDYPDYHRLKYDIRTASVSYLQDTLLRPNQSLLEYFVGDSAVYIFVVARKKFDLREVKLDFPLEQWVSQLRRGLYGYHVAHKNLSMLPDSVILQYADPAWRLYEKLVAPVERLLADEVIVVPDGALGYVPFDVLLKEPVFPPPSSRFHSYQYLGDDHDISYCYSATLLREMSEKQHKSQSQLTLLAMAPFAPDKEQLLSESSLNTVTETMPRDTLATLFFSGKEVQAISNIFPGRTLLGAAADKQALLKNCGSCNILHLNTHGKADDKVGEYAWLGLAAPGDSPDFDKLYVKDIYNLSLNADLVVLSACETGIGALKRGEGIISLARAFAFAGAKSIVTSLWSVDDKSTGELMQLFYQNLQNGLRKDEAMAKAKKDFRNANKGTKYAHPFFWAGFIPIGDMAPINRN